MKKLFLTLLFLLLFLPIVQQIFHFLPEPYLNENRHLSTQPKLYLTNIIEFPPLFEKYYNDHFGFRSSLIQLNNYFQTHLLLKKYVNGVIIGQDGWLFLDNGLGSSVEPLKYSNKQLDAIEIKKQAITKKLANMEIVYIEVLVPDKNSVYLDKLPEKTNNDIKTTILSQRGSTTLLSLFNKEKKYPVYYKTDSHWNRYGSYLAYRDIIKSLAITYSHISPLQIKNNKIALVPKKGGDLSRMLAQEFKYSDEETQFDIDTSTTTNKNKLGKIIVYYDSFFDPQYPWSTMQFLKEHFHEVLLIKNSKPIDFEYITKEKPDVVLFEIIERALDNRKM